MGFVRVHDEVQEYEVFARKTRLEPLRQVGAVVTPDDELAMAYARATYDEANAFLNQGKQALAEKDDVAASGFAQKASVLADKLQATVTAR